MTDSYVQVPPDSTGKQIATDEIAGKHYQIVRVADGDGLATDSASEDTLQTVTMLLAQMKAQMPRLDAAGRLITNNGEITQGVSGGLSTVSTVSNITSISGYSFANQMFYPPIHIYGAIVRS